MEHPTVFKPMLGYVRAELIVNCVIVFLVLIIVSLRVLGRYRGPGLWWDDYLVIFAVVSSLSPESRDQIIRGSPF
jgi:hypothetical protein